MKEADPGKPSNKRKAMDMTDSVDNDNVVQDVPRRQLQEREEQKSTIVLHIFEKDPQTKELVPTLDLHVVAGITVTESK